MTVVEKLKRLSDDHAKGRISQADFDRRRADLLDKVEVAETLTEAPPDPVEGSFDPGVTLTLVILLSILPGLVVMLVFNLPFWTGATVFVTCLGALTWAWSRTLPEEPAAEQYAEINLDDFGEKTA